MHAELLLALALLRPVVRELRRSVLKLRRAHGQIDHGRERIAFLIDQLVRNSLQLRVAVLRRRAGHRIAPRRIGRAAAHDPQHVVERHLIALAVFKLLLQPAQFERRLIRRAALATAGFLASWRELARIGLKLACTQASKTSLIMGALGGAARVAHRLVL